MLRDIITIDEDLCDGCGLCVPACHEGALQIIDGKARLVSDRLCDGLGDCLGHCPQGAIKVERRQAEEFDEKAVAENMRAAEVADNPPKPNLRTTEGIATCPLAETGLGTSRLAGTNSRTDKTTAQHHGGCPGSRLAQFLRPDEGPDPGSAPHEEGRPQHPSALTQWPVKLRLLPPSAPVLRGARLLVAADCVPVAYGGFHSELLRDHAVVIACPKLDDTSGYVEKLAEMIQVGQMRDITVARMEVPCCAGILHMVLEARRIAGSDVPVFDVVISTHGAEVIRREIPVESTVDSDNSGSGMA